MAEVILSSSGRKTILCKLLIFLVIFCVHTKVSLGEEISEPLNIDETVDVLAAEERLLEILQGIQDQEENQEKLQRSLTKRSKFSNVLLNSQNDPEITPLRLEAPQLLSFSTNNGPTILKEVPANSPINNGENAATKSSLWDTIKKNFYEGQTLARSPLLSNSQDLNATTLAPSTEINSVLEGISKVTSPLHEAWQNIVLKAQAKQNSSNDETSRIPRDSSWSVDTSAMAWDTAKVMGSVGKDLVSHVYQKHIVDKNDKEFSPVKGFLKGIVENAYGWKLGYWDIAKQKTRDLAIANYNYQDNKVKNFQNNFLAKSKTKPTTSIMTSVLSSMGSASPSEGYSSGWSSSSAGKNNEAPVIYVTEMKKDLSLVKQYIKAKLSMKKHIILTKYRMKKELYTKLIPAIFNIKINVLKSILTLISQKDKSLTYQILKVIKNAIQEGIQAKVNFFTAKKEFAKGMGSIANNGGWSSSTESPAYGVPTLRSPVDTYGAPPALAPVENYGVVPALRANPTQAPSSSYGLPSLTYDSSNGRGNQETGYTGNQGGYQQHTPSGPITYSNVAQIASSYGVPTTATPTTTQNPLYAYPSAVVQDPRNRPGANLYAEYAAPNLQTIEYPTLPPVSIPPQVSQQQFGNFQSPSSFTSSSSNDNSAVVISSDESKFLRMLLRAANDNSRPSQFQSNTANIVQSTASVEQHGLEPPRNRFSSQLLNAGFA